MVVGTGFGCTTHVRALAAAGFEVTGLVGRDLERTRARAARFGVAAAFDDVGAALHALRPDAVTVATPPHTHAEVVLASLDAGCHVICEKPFARDTAEAEEMAAALRRSGTVGLMGTEFRFDAGQAALAAAVGAGAVGEPRLVTVLLHIGSLADPAADLPDWWREADEGGGWLGAHGSQVIDQLRATVGEFESVSATLVDVAGRPGSAEDGFILQFRLRSGAVGTVQTTAADRGPFLVETRVTGSVGTAWIEGVGSTVKVATKEGTRRIAADERLCYPPPPPLPEGSLSGDYDRMVAHGLDLGPYTRLAEVFAALIRREPAPEGPAPASFDDGVALMRVLDAARRSVVERRFVDVGG